MYARTHTAIADSNNEPSPVHKMTESLVSNKSRQISQLFHFMDLSGTFGSASFLRDDELSGTLLHLLLFFFLSLLFFKAPGCRQLAPSSGNIFCLRTYLFLRNNKRRSKLAGAAWRGWGDGTERLQRAQAVEWEWEWRWSGGRGGDKAGKECGMEMRGWGGEGHGGGRKWRVEAGGGEGGGGRTKEAEVQRWMLTRQTGSLPSLRPSPPFTRTPPPHTPRPSSLPPPPPPPHDS